jgi:hypothetical protein
MKCNQPVSEGTGMGPITHDACVSYTFLVQ